ncbi:MAG: methyltransferase domain-containing protein [Kordiimonadaceae bacterium]|nr:methyltransferase domain-containing protein [Kordiimonadaceae bacterium]
MRLIQPKTGYRVSMDTVMLAASVPAVAGDKVLEGGVGTGGAALCLAKRVQGVLVEGIEQQDDMLLYANRNILFNGLANTVSVQKGDITDLSEGEGQYDHVMVNPPYLPDGTAIRPPVETKGLAHMDTTATLKDWMRFCVYKARNKGTITVIYRADRVDEVIAHLHRRVGELKIMPFWPRAGVPAKRVIIQGRKGMRGVASLLPGMALHSDTERYTPEAKQILWDGDALDLKAFACKR